MQIRAVPWVRLGAEAVAIVLSILAAFAIDAWWDATQQRQQLEAVLQSLESEFAESLTLLDENIAHAEGDRARLERFIDMDPGEAGRIPPDSIWGFLQAIWRPNTEDNNTSLLMATLDDPSLKLLRDHRLQNAVARWRFQVDELEERAGQLAAAEREALRALGQHPDIRPVLALPQRATSLKGATMRRGRVRQDDEVMAIAAMKVFQARIQLQSLGVQREQVDSALGFLRSR